MTGLCCHKPPARPSGELPRHRGDRATSLARRGPRRAVSDFPQSVTHQRAGVREGPLARPSRATPAAPLATPSATTPARTCPGSTTAWSRALARAGTARAPDGDGGRPGGCHGRAPSVVVRGVAGTGADEFRRRPRAAPRRPPLPERAPGRLGKDGGGVKTYGVSSYLGPGRGRGEQDHAEIVVGELLVAGGRAAVPLQAVEAEPDPVKQPVEVAAELPPARSAGGGGITARPPCASTRPTTRSLSQPLSAMTAAPNLPSGRPGAGRVLTGADDDAADKAGRAVPLAGELRE